MSRLAIKLNKRILFVCTIIVVTAVTFWSGSRYPSLDQKAIMGGSAALEDPLAFEASIQIQPNDGTIERIIYTTINWIETNLEGMAFGLMIGACLLTLISMVRVRGHRNGFVNTMIGVAVGTPLGVCVNCSAPVAKGLHDGGARLETTLATMFSSPTLNIVVLTMLFSRAFAFWVSASRMRDEYALLAGPMWGGPPSSPEPPHALDASLHRVVSRPSPIEYKSWECEMPGSASVFPNRSPAG